MTFIIDHENDQDAPEDATPKFADYVLHKSEVTITNPLGMYYVRRWVADEALTELWAERCRLTERLAEAEAEVSRYKLICDKLLSSEAGQ